MASKDSERDEKTRQTFRGLSNTLCSDEFILNLGLMMHCLSELSIVSQPLQNDQITLSYAYQVLTRSVRIFQKMKESGSAQYVMESQEGVASRRYRGVCVDITSDEKRISSRKHSAIRGRRKRES